MRISDCSSDVCSSDLAFTDRFDANAYLYITRAMDYFDLADPHDGRLAGAFAGAKDVRFTLVSFDTAWLYPTSESRRVVQALQNVGAVASFGDLSALFEIASASRR